MSPAATAPAAAPPAAFPAEEGGLQIWTDGSCLVNPNGPGGWSIVVVDDGEVEETRCGSRRSTTNNIMEMWAVLEALKEVRPDVGVEIVSDSKYVVEGLNVWIHNWKRNGWRRQVRNGFKPVLNQELWQRLDLNFNRDAVTISWAKGHAGHVYNEMADELANFAARNLAERI